MVLGSYAFIWGQREWSFCLEHNTFINYPCVNLQQNFKRQIPWPPALGLASTVQYERRHVPNRFVHLFLTDSGVACFLFPIEAQASEVNCWSLSLSNTFCIGWQGVRFLNLIHTEIYKGGGSLPKKCLQSLVKEATGIQTK